MVFGRFCKGVMAGKKLSVKPEDKTFWNKIVEIFRGQYGVHMDPIELLTNAVVIYNNYDCYGSVKGLALNQ